MNSSHAHTHHHTHDNHHRRSLNAAHEHFFLGENHERNERRTWLVIAITATMMVVEIAAGNMFGSMALTADGWHMSTHAAALLIAALAYLYARKHAGNRRFSFGTGKLGDLAGFASAVVLALIALLIGWESFLRFQSPVTINFKEGAEIVDLHIWQLGPGHHGAIVSLVADHPQTPSYYPAKLAAIHDLSHVTVEVEARAA